MNRQQVGPYRIIKPLGRGGMGMVYLAVDDRLDRQVALKFLSGPLTGNPVARERFLNEARAASRIDHPNICTVYEAGETEEGEAYLAMAFYEGETLREHLARGPLEVEEAIDLVIQIGHGLERAHEAGIIHRDIKPENVIVTSRGEAKVLDFGLARLRHEAHITREGTRLGTPAYMAPEQVRGEEAGFTADVWALGVVLYEALTGRPPFGGSSETAPTMILHEEPRRVDEARPGLPAGLDAIITRALAKNPGDRYSSIREMVADLESVRSAWALSSFATIETPPEVSERKRSNMALTLAALGVIAVLVFGWWFLVRDVGEEPDSAAGDTSATSVITILPFEVRGSPDWEYLEEGMVDLLATKLDGAGEIRATDPNAVLAIASDSTGGQLDLESARGVARRLGAGFFLLGDVLESNGRLHLTASLYGTEGSEAQARVSVEGEGTSLFDLVDSLTTELLAEGFVSSKARIARTAALTSESLVALKSYLQGESLFRSGRFVESLEAFELAVAEDPEFALAWYRVSVAAEWATRLHQIEPAASRAVELSDRLSERDRRLLEARVLLRNGRVEEAEGLYRSLVREYPDEIEAWSQLGEVLSHYRFLTGTPLTASREAWEQVLSFESNNVSALWHLARVASAEGDHEELTDLVERLLPVTPESERRLEIRALEHYGTGASAGESVLLSELAATDGRAIWLAAWNVAISTDNLAGCASILELLTQQVRPAAASAWAKATLGFVSLARGQPESAWRWSHGARADLEAFGLEMAVPFAVTPPTSASDTELLSLHRELLDWAADETPPQPEGALWGRHDPWHPTMRLFGLGIVEAALGEASAVERAGQLDALGTRFAADLATTVRGYQALLGGDAQAAVEELDTIDLRAPVYNYNDAIVSPYFAASVPRYLLTRALVASGQWERALEVADTFGDTSIADRAFEPLALLVAAEALFDLGRPAEAQAALERVSTLWSEREPVMEEWLQRADR